MGGRAARLVCRAQPLPLPGPRQSGGRVEAVRASAGALCWRGWPAADSPAAAAGSRHAAPMLRVTLRPPGHHPPTYLPSSCRLDVVTQCPGMKRCLAALLAREAAAAAGARGSDFQVSRGCRPLGSGSAAVVWEGRRHRMLSSAAWYTPAAARSPVPAASRLRPPGALRAGPAAVRVHAALQRGAQRDGAHLPRQALLHAAEVRCALRLLRALCCSAACSARWGLGLRHWLLGWLGCGLHLASARCLPLPSLAGATRATAAPKWKASTCRCAAL